MQVSGVVGKLLGMRGLISLMGFHRWSLKRCRGGRFVFFFFPRQHHNHNHCPHPHPLSEPMIIPSPNPPISHSIYYCNQRLTSLGRQGKLQQARKLFDEMPHRDDVSYTSMISLYIKNNHLHHAQDLFHAMPERNVVSNSAMIDAYAKAGSMDARRIFDHMPTRNVFSWTSLVSGYFRNGLLNEARQLFHRMPAKNLVSWTTALLGYAQNGLIDQARTIFDQIPHKNVVAWTAMIKSYVDCRQTDQALELFHKMPQRNLYSWSIIIRGCLDDNRVAESIKLFDSMPLKNAVSWTTMVTGLARLGSTELARDYFDRMPNKDVAAWNTMITAYANEDLMAEASELFFSMPERNTVTWNAMIDGYAKRGPEGEALKHLILMLRCCIRPNETTLTSVLSSCEGVLELMQAHALAVRLGHGQGVSLTNSLITSYSRAGDVSSARLAFDNLEEKDTVSWTAMISSYSNHGCGDQALQTFARMLRSGVKPDEVTFVGVLSACSHAGFVKKGQRFFNSMMHSYGLEPKAEHYSCLIDILGRAGLIDEAVRVVCQMPPGELDGAVLGALLGACKLHGDAGLASHLGQELIELEPTQSGDYVLLANVYAACGKWKESAKVRKQMKERKVKKVPGYSQIQVKGNGHVFYVGDRSHPDSKEIFLMLREKLLPLMREMGYSQDPHVML